MTLREVCNDCDWEEIWGGGGPDKDPGVKHVRETGHRVRAEVV